MGKWNSKEESENKEIRYLLSIDGGGMRGIIPAYLLTRMDGILKEIGDTRPLYSHFDLISGTSTGALIALGLTCPTEDTIFEKDGDNFKVKETITKRSLFRHRKEEINIGEIETLTSIEDLLNLYLEKGGEIFRQDSSLLKKLSILLTEKYNAADLELFLQNTFGKTLLKDAYVPTMAVSYNTLTGKPYIFRSWDSKGFEVSAAARATSAAPTYFSPVNFLEPETGNRLVLIDGGVCANNPALLTYNEARNLYPNATEYRLLSLSTCSPLYTFDPLDSVSGLAGWANNIWHIYASASMEIADETARSIKNLNYFRLWKKISEKKIKLDDVSEESLNILLKGAEDLFNENEKEIREFLTNMSKEKIHSSLKLVNQNALLLENK